MADWHALAQALNRTMAAYAPGWTDHSGHDPGVTVLEVIVYLMETLQSQLTPEDRQSLVSKIIGAIDDECEPSTVFVNGERWKRVSTMDEAAPGDPVYVIDEATGTITFGDGVCGRVPEPGSTIVARYRQGGGGGGNASRGDAPVARPKVR